MNREVASIHAQAKRDRVQFAEFDATASCLFQRSDDPASHPLLKGVGGDVPAEKPERDQAENAKRQKQLPQNARRSGGGGRLVSTVRFSGVGLRSKNVAPRAQIRQPSRQQFVHLLLGQQVLMRP